MEIGSPMACLYLLDNPDHYTDHTFIPFWWRSYVQQARRSFDDASADITNMEEKAEDKKVVIGRENGQYVGKSVVDDYTFRPDCYEEMSLIEWIQCSVKRK
ncbi:hypothetical protein CPC08DRAFT_598647, partial [Agrocybe pediades]